MNEKVSQNNLIIPEDFPWETFQAIRSRVGHYQNRYPEQRVLFAGGWRALLYRFKALAEYDSSFTLTVNEFGAQSIPEYQYLQEKALFGFFSSGLSCIESYFFSAYAIGAIIEKKTFLITSRDLKTVWPKEVINRYQRIMGAGSLVDRMKSLIKSKEYIQWKHLRNILTHRVAVSRRGLERSKEPTGTVWELTPHYGIKPFYLDGETTSLRRQWLSNQLGMLIDEFDIFTKKHLPPPDP